MARDILEKIAQGIDDFMHLPGEEYVPKEHPKRTHPFFVGPLGEEDTTMFEFAVGGIIIAWVVVCIAMGLAVQ